MDSRNWLARFFGVVARCQTYLNILYLLLAFPLGLAYFIFFVVGFALGIPLIILWVGFLILLVVFAGWWLFILFERQQAIWLLRVELPPLWRESVAGKPVWDQVKAYASNPVTWLGLVFLLLKFPIGIICFVVVVASGAITLALLTAPLTFAFWPIEVMFDWSGAWVWRIDTFWEALIAFGVGIVVGFLALHLMNGLAWVLGRLAHFMLADPRLTAPAASSPSAASQEPVPQEELADQAATDIPEDGSEGNDSEPEAPGAA